uniref:Uncharacterized protein n=1 Tax=Chromera velia CCMP2878 TaxID=1169474 RepID=A0A0G4GX73_9ALVE|eukprot:Cvel_23754.t1-p1 / transcript=Cvel_23754.t1 / gene=Cvel_23754 / organism=Chromera_velia_CCMP2878 / gene_product=hypothetical protein / transcript_product=hypothetical protein / location=Cvel_scaffold2488:15929-16234(-) / protein_length=102 / sequence_SO=supercontig / SO=protein_coding / is_pseudo=false
MGSIPEAPQRVLEEIPDGRPTPIHMETEEGDGENPRGETETGEVEVEVGETGGEEEGAEAERRGEGEGGVDEEDSMDKKKCSSPLWCPLLKKRVQNPANLPW